MKRILTLAVVSALLGCEVGEFEGEEYGPNHALIQEAGLKFKGDCLSCHGGGAFGEEEAQTFNYAGTVWDRPNGDPLPGVKIVLIAVGASDSIVLTTDRYGNLRTSYSLSTAGYSAKVECPNGKVLAMRLHPYHGGCNDCHRPGGKAGSVLFCNE